MEYKFKKILIGFDNSSSSKVALDKALQTCQAFGSDLYVVNVKSSKSNEGDFKDEITQKAAAFGVQIHFGRLCIGENLL